MKPSPAAAERVLRAEAAAIGALARADVRIDPAAERAADAVLKVVEGSEIHVSLAGVVDVEAERARLGKELRKVEEDLARTEAKLGREDFRQRAPAEVVAREEARRAEHRGAPGDAARGAGAARCPRRPLSPRSIPR